MQIEKKIRHKLKEKNKELDSENSSTKKEWDDWRLPRERQWNPVALIRVDLNPKRAQLIIELLEKKSTTTV